MAYEEKPTASQLKILRVVLGVMVFSTGAFSARLMLSSLLVAFDGPIGGNEGSRAFFMSLSSLTLMVFCGGFVMMIREVNATIKKRLQVA